MKLKKFSEMEPKEKKVKVKKEKADKTNPFGSMLSKVKQKKAGKGEVIAEITNEEVVDAQAVEETVSQPSEKLSKGKALAAKIKSNKFAMGIATKLMKKKDAGEVVLLTLPSFRHSE